jgi:hypothetical protein
MPWKNDRLVAEAFAYTTTTTDEHPYPQRDSNPRSQQSSGRRPTPQTVRLTQSATPLLYLIIPYQQCGPANFWVESDTFPVSRLLYSPSVSTRFEILHSCCVISFCDVVWHHSLNASEIWYESDCGRHLEVVLKTTNGCDSRLAAEKRDLCLRTLQRLTLICIVCKGSARTAQ